MVGQMEEREKLRDQEESESPPPEYQDVTQVKVCKNDSFSFV